MKIFTTQSGMKKIKYMKTSMSLFCKTIIVKDVEQEVRTPTKQCTDLDLWEYSDGKRVFC